MEIKGFDPKAAEKRVAEARAQLASSPVPLTGRIPSPLFVRRNRPLPHPLGLLAIQAFIRDFNPEAKSQMKKLSFEAAYNGETTPIFTELVLAREGILQ